MHEKIEVHGRAGRICTASGRGWHASRRGVPEDGRVGGDLTAVGSSFAVGLALRSCARCASLRKRIRSSGAWSRTYRSTRRCCRRFWQKSLAPGRRREIVHWVQDRFRVSERRGCSALRFDRRTHRYKSGRPDQAPLRERIKEIAATRVRYGYRRIHVLLRREGWPYQREAGPAPLSHGRV